MKKGNPPILDRLGTNIRKIRLSQGISQNQLAYETGLTREFINKLENGKANVSVKKLALIADSLNVSPKKFFD